MIAGLMLHLSRPFAFAPFACCCIHYSPLEDSISGPPFWYGQVGWPYVKHPGVTLFFANTAGAKEFHDTTVSQGRFPEVAFALKLTRITFPMFPYLKFPAIQSRVMCKLKI